MLTKEEAEKLFKLKGETRGINLKIDLDFVLQEKGREGIEKVEADLAKLGYPIKYKDLKPMEFYPIGLGAINLLTVKDLFSFDEKKIKEWGVSLVKFSLIEKIFMKYFASLNLIAKQIPHIWKKHFTIGDLEMPEYSKKERYSVLRLRDFKIHPIYCNIFTGYFAKITELIVKDPAITKESKCMFRGDDYHEFTTKW